MKKKLFVLAAVFAVAAVTLANTVSVAWDPSPSPLVGKYTVYVYNNSDLATNHLAAKISTTTTNATITNLTAGVSYWVNVTASDTNNLESVPSNTIMFGWPTPPQTLRIQAP